jgi:fatty-acyl-CoA synthase
MGEAVHALVQLTDGAQLADGELRQWSQHRLNDLWAPKVIDFVTELPLTALGKLDKKALRQLHAEVSRTREQDH